MNRIGQIDQVYGEAIQLEREGRSDSSNAQPVAEAARKFAQAAELSEEATACPDLHPLERLQASVFAKYYRFCAARAQAWYSYRQRDTSAAAKASSEAESLIAQGIAAGRDYLTRALQEQLPRMNELLLSWEHEQRCQVGIRYAIVARGSWDAGCVIEALDAYRRAADHMKESLEFIKSHRLPAADERIMAGNYAAMLANESQVFALIRLGRGKRDGATAVSRDDFILLMRHIIEAYKLGMAAFRANPEWTEYDMMVRACRSSLRVLLEGNPDSWLSLYCEFEDENIVLNTMKEIDLPRFKKAEVARHMRESKALKLWSVGSFWLLVLLIIGFGVTVVFTQCGLLTALFIVIVVEALFMLIGAFLLRSTGDLSQNNFIKLIGIAAQSQLKSIMTLFSRSRRAGSASNGKDTD